METKDSNYNNSNINHSDNNPDDQESALANTAFISEKIKQRPINRKKLLRRTITTVSLAVLFGGVACLTFFVLEPLINAKLYPEPEPTPVSLTEEVADTEILPEDMYADDSEIVAEAANIALSIEETEREVIDQAIASYIFDSNDFSQMYSSLRKLANTALTSVVTVTSVTSDYNWFNDPYSKSDSVSGLLIADNGLNTMVLVSTSAISDAQSIQVTFCNGITLDATLQMSDSISGLSILAIPDSKINSETEEVITYANLGTSNYSSLAGMPVIAVGHPVGVEGSICYGNITSEKETLNLADSSYKLLTTDIYGSSNGSGVLINLNGQVVGFITMAYNSDDNANVVCAYGISELKKLIEDLSNERNRPYLGIHASTVPEYAHTNNDIPEGVYITQVDMDSPAMKAGLQSGDIICGINGEEIISYDSFLSQLIEFNPEDEITLNIKRFASEEYIDLELEATLTNSTE
ncbi:MAG: S1C family serine protease [Butyrivibrio sp.]|nr:S1C family serine protease [Butyrivibrio sp.]